jgi:hypothetical protein
MKATQPRGCRRPICLDDDDAEQPVVAVVDEPQRDMAGPGFAPMSKIVGLHPLPPAANVRASGY